MVAEAQPTRVSAQLRSRRQERFFNAGPGQVSRLTTPQACVVTEAPRGLQLQVIDGSPRQRGGAQRATHPGHPARSPHSGPWLLRAGASGAIQARYCSDRCRKRALKRADHERHREAAIDSDADDADDLPRTSA